MGESMFTHSLIDIFLVFIVLFVTIVIGRVSHGDYRSIYHKKSRREGKVKVKGRGRRVGAYSGVTALKTARVALRATLAAACDSSVCLGYAGSFQEPTSRYPNSQTQQARWTPLRLQVLLRSRQVSRSKCGILILARRLPRYGLTMV